MGLGKTLQVIALTKLLLHHPIVQHASAIALPQAVPVPETPTFPSVERLKLLAVNSFKKSHFRPSLTVNYYEKIRFSVGPNYGQLPES